MRLKQLSPNLTLLMKEILKSQEICKLLKYNSPNPFVEPDIENTDELILKKVFPFSFDIVTSVEEGTQLRIHYPEINLDSREMISDSKIYFDIVCSKTQNIWLMNDGEHKIRPYEVASHVVDYFSDKVIDSIGKIKFHNIKHFYANEKFDLLRITASVKTASM